VRSPSLSPQFTVAGGGARIPGVAFVNQSKLALLPYEDIAIPFAPDLAIEIISNSEIAARAEKKVQEYLASGVQEIWQVYPTDRFVRIRTAEGSRDLSEEQLLETYVLPGFQVKVQAFFAR
jgi:Uma2 family endonuclease